MAFADPQSVTIGAVTTPLPRILTNNGVGLFQSNDGNVKIEVTPKNNGKTKTRQHRLRTSKITTDPLVSTTNVRVELQTSLFILRPTDGYSDAEVLAQVKGHIAHLSASSDAALIKLIAGEN